MVKHKNILLLGIFILAGIFISLSFASATLNITMRFGEGHGNVRNNSNLNLSVSGSGASGSGGNSTNSIFINVTFVNSSTGDITVGNGIGRVNINATFYMNVSGTWTFVGNSSTCAIGGAEASIGACWGNLTLNGTTGYDGATLPDGIYSINVTLWNGSSQPTSNYVNVTFGTGLAHGIVIDNNPPEVLIGAWVSPVGAGKNFTGNLILNISINDTGMGVQTVFFNISNGTSGVQNSTSTATAEGTSVQGSTTRINYAVTISTSEYIDGLYNITVWANDTQFGQTSNTTVFTWGLKFDNTAPSGTVTCTPSTVQAGATVTCTCSGTDATSGSNSTKVTTTLSTSNTGSHPVSCTIVDTAGNSGTASGSYNVELGGGGGGGTSGGGSAATSATPGATVTKEFTTVSAGELVTMSSGLGIDYGLKSVSIEVNNPAQNVKITVNKYTNVPTAVSVEKVGKVYRYLQINAENVQGNLKKGVISAQVSKSWVASNGLSKDDIAMYKFTDGAWKELTTTFKTDDGSNYLYDVEVDSFSYFVLGERAEQVVAEEPPKIAEEKGSNWLTWLGVIAAIIIVAGLIYWITRKK